MEDHQFVRGIPIYAIGQVLEKIVQQAPGPLLLINGVKRPMPSLRILEVELFPTLLSKARNFGLSDRWVQVIDLLILDCCSSILVNENSIPLHSYNTRWSLTK